MEPTPASPPVGLPRSQQNAPGTDGSTGMRHGTRFKQKVSLVSGPSSKEKLVAFSL